MSFNALRLYVTSAPGPSGLRRAAAALALVMTIGSVPAGAASLIVDWGGDYVSSSQILQRNTYVNGSLGGILFSDTQAMSPASGYSGTSDTFYGGAIAALASDSSGTPAIPGHVLDSAAVSNQGPNDSIHINLSHQGDWHDLHSVLLWDDADFLTGAAPFTFGSDSVVTIGLASLPNEVQNNVQIRLVVRNDLNQYFVSETAFNPGSQVDKTNFVWNASNQFGGPTSGWASYSPSGSSMNFVQSGASYSPFASPFTAIGFLWDLDTFHNNTSLHVENFSVRATAIPEPSTIGAGITAALLGLLATIRRRMTITGRS